jgi:hypothetical protein
MKQIFFYTILFVINIFFLILFIIYRLSDSEKVQSQIWGMLYYFIYLYFFVVILYNIFLIIYDQETERKIKRYLLFFFNIPFLLLMSDSPLSPIFLLSEILFKSNYHLVIIVTIIIHFLLWSFLLKLIIPNKNGKGR